MWCETLCRKFSFFRCKIEKKKIFTWSNKKNENSKLDSELLHCIMIIRQKKVFPWVSLKRIFKLHTNQHLKLIIVNKKKRRKKRERKKNGKQCWAVYNRMMRRVNAGKKSYPTFYSVRILHFLVSRTWENNLKASPLRRIAEI